MAGGDTLARLAAVIESRKPENGGDPAKSYVARLLAKGTDAILKKVGEEATELVLAAKGETDERVAEEAADLLFHTMVVLAQRGVRLADVLGVLERRRRR